jgi:hypothetical protein
VVFKALGATECSSLSIPHARCQFHTPVVNSTRSVLPTFLLDLVVFISEHLVGPHRQFPALSFFIGHIQNKAPSCFGTKGPGFIFHTPVVELTPLVFLSHCPLARDISRQSVLTRGVPCVRSQVPWIEPHTPIANITPLVLIAACTWF